MGELGLFRAVWRQGACRRAGPARIGAHLWAAAAGARVSAPEGWADELTRTAPPMLSPSAHPRTCYSKANPPPPP
eukprot:scaffold24717_cov45-Isochrysis_galbana.AAC.1